MKRSLILAILLAALLSGALAVAEQNKGSQRDSVHSWGEWAKMIPPAARKAPANGRDLREQEWKISPIDFQSDITVEFAGRTEVLQR